MAFEVSREEQMTEKELKWGYWWVTHKIQVRKAFIVFMIILDAFLVGYAGWGYLDWFFGSGVRERAIMATLTVPWIPSEVIRATRPQALAIEPAAIINAGDSKYDLVARVTNPSFRFWVEFDYHFAAGDAVVGKARHGFLLPESSKFLHALGAESESYPSGASVVLENVVWHRIDRHVVQPDFRTWGGERLNFTMTDIGFKPPDPTESVPVSRASFTVANDSAYGYKEVGFLVVLRGSSGLAGVNFVTVSDLRAGEVRTVNASWFEDLPGVDSVEVEAEVNIFDPGVYMPTGR